MQATKEEIKVLIKASYAAGFMDAAKVYGGKPLTKKADIDKMIDLCNKYEERVFSETKHVEEFE
jgi:hypothetical protein